MLESEESCVYCSKCLVGLNDFNRKMHIETCKVRKLVDANRNADDNQLENYIVLGDNCSYCFKSFKDFKSDFNKRLHIKCCKIKKETYDEKNSVKMNLGGEHCVFCTKPLGNLNEFNKRMHIENCKIRKSIENSGSSSGLSNGSKDDNLIKIGLELGDSCMYCSKSFLNLSDFNKKLHFEYCKLKKKKLNGLNGTDLTGSLNNSMNTSNNSLNLSALGQQQQQSQQQQHGGDDKSGHKIDLGESCLFCSRSLANLSNFNKRIHIETCKVKTLKKATNKMKQSQSAKANRKRPAKKDQRDQNQSLNYFNSCQNLNKSLTLELMGTTSVQNANMNPTLNPAQLSQYDTIAATLNLPQTLQLTSIPQLNTQQIKLDPTGQYGQNPNGIYI